MDNPSFRMFCAEYKGDLVTSYISARADDVRRQACNGALGPGLYSPARWKALTRVGWRVVRVRVQKID